MKKALLGVLLASLMITLSTPPFPKCFELQAVDAPTMQDSIDQSSIIDQVATSTNRDNLNLFTFYYPWYGNPLVSGSWRHWPEGIAHYPLLDKYDSNNESLIKRHMDIARQANIDGFVASWWGKNSFEDRALLHIKRVCEENRFKFTIYYETTTGVEHTVNDLAYILDNYAKSSSWHKIESRPVIYVYGRARDQLDPEHTDYWVINGSSEWGTYVSWRPYEEVRSPSRQGIFVIHPCRDGIGYLQSKGYVTLPPNDTYCLRISVSDVKDDCHPYSDVGFRVKIRTDTEDWQTLGEVIANFVDGWVDLTYDVSSYAGQNVLIRVESFDGGVQKWASEWAAVDSCYIMDSKSRILNQNPYLDNEWKLVRDGLKARGYDPYIVMDYTGYEDRVEDFARYFLSFTDGIHSYAPYSFSIQDIAMIYNRASEVTRSVNKTFVATVMPGFDDTKASWGAGNVVDRKNGSYYNSSWSAAKLSFPNEYIITSFNEWHEGSEIEPSLEYGDLYINLTFANTLDLLAHDVSVENISPSKTVIGRGSTTCFNITVMNWGDCIENCNVTVYANSTLVGTHVSSVTYGTRGMVLPFFWNTTDVSLGVYEIRAIVDQLAGEIDISNNEFVYSSITMSILGDIVADGKVNILDISLAAKAFGSNIGDSRWDCNADVNEDGAINILDISAIAKDFGKTA